MDNASLEAKNISTFYGRSQALFGVSLKVPSRGCVAVIGRNGAGKTTLMQSLAGELRPSSGEVLLRGTDCTSLSTEKRARFGLGYVPQNGNIFSGLTVLENLQLGGRFSSDNQAVMDLVLQLFPKLEARRKQKAGTLSGGERKMVAIARALLGKPDVVMLDEPTEGVWHKVIDEIGESLREIAKDKAVLLVEQHLGLAFSIADYCYVMDRGTIALEGPVEEIKRDPRLDKLLAP